jgi:hypothetical protein
MKKRPFLLLLTIAFLTNCERPGSRLFDFTPDVRLFTAYAFMNAAGNDAEWRKAGMHPIRLAVREELDGTLDSTFQKKIRDFSSDHGGSWTLWGSYALITDGPPDFHITYDPKTTPYGKSDEESKTGLSDLFAEFYTQGRIGQLWNKYKPLLQMENDRFEPFAEKALGDIETYCRLKKRSLSGRKRVHFQSMPLMLYFTAWTAKVNGEMWIVGGPQEGEPDASAFYHETLHHVVGPLVEKYTSEIDRSAGLNDLAKSAGDIGYDSWPDRVEDCFTRTLDKVLEAKLWDLDRTRLNQMLEDEYRLGFILCFSIAESLADYEAQTLTFEEYFPKILLNIDVAREKRRWEEFWKEP